MTNGYITRKTGNVRVLNLRIVKIVEVIQDDDFMLRSQQLLGKMRADKPGASSDQDSHGSKLAKMESSASLWLAAFSTQAGTHALHLKNFASAAANKSSLGQAQIRLRHARIFLSGRSKNRSADAVRAP